MAEKALNAWWRRGREWWLGAVDWTLAPWRAFHWNLRKSLFVLTGRHAACPCHDPSDDGLPGKTRCLAALWWHRPERFRKVCPLLVRTDHGWCCSVGPEAVRPYWGRFALTGLVLLSAAYLGTGVAGTLALRMTGVRRINVLHFWWPPRWGEIQSLRTEFFREKAFAAARRGDAGEALLALASARAIDPGDYGSGLLQAQIEAVASGQGMSGLLFAQLLQEFPGRAGEIALIYHDQLLAAQALRALAELCLARLEARDGLRAIWVRSLLFALECGRLAPAFQGSDGEVLEKIDPALATAVSALAAEQIGATEEARALLRNSRRLPGDPIVRRARIEWLLRWGRLDDAQEELNLHAAALGPFETAALQYRRSMAAHDTDLAAVDFRIVLRQEPTAARIDRLCGLAVVTGSREAPRQLLDFVSGQSKIPLASVADDLWAAAAAVGDGASAARIATAVAAAVGGETNRIARIDFVSTERTNPAAIPYIVNARKLGRETIYALVECSIRAREARAPRRRERRE